MKDETTQIYDKIFKRILTLSKTAVINFINAAFRRAFPLDSELSYHWTENIKDDLERTISDTIITVNGTEKFHIEAQIGNDNTIVLRVYDYGYQDALKHKTVNDDTITLTFPQPKIIFLEHNSSTPDSVKIILNFLEQGTFTYSVPTMKFLTYTAEELSNQKMVILLPLYLLKLRKEIESSKKKGSVKDKAPELKKLLNEDIIKAIEENRSIGSITSEDSRVLINLLNKLYRQLYGGIKEFEDEGVTNMLAEKLIFEYEIAREETKLTEKVETAKRFLKLGLSVEQVAKGTELSSEIITQIHEALEKGNHISAIDLKRA